MDKSKPILMLIFAVFIALFVTLLSYNWLQNLKKKTDVKPSSTQPIAIATFDLSWGTSITKEMVKMAPFLKDSLPPGTFSDSDSLVGRTLLYPIKANEPIFESKLAPVSVKAGGVAAIITPKKRAIAVKVDRVVGVSGFIYPGHRVDVLTTLRRRGDEEPAITKTVLENILVLAAGTEMERTDQHEKPTQVDVITLEVTPEEGEKLSLAATEGKLLLALRNFSDTEDVVTAGITIPDLLASYSSPFKKSASKPAVRRTGGVRRKSAPKIRKPVFFVELIKGDEVIKLQFEEGKRKYVKTQIK